MRNAILRGALAVGALAFASVAVAQTYFDSSGTKVEAFVPLGGCPTGGGKCTGPAAGGTGGGAGTFNNNGAPVAPSATNGQAAAWAYLWDGTNWQAAKGDTANGLWVNVKAGGTSGTFNNNGAPVAPSANNSQTGAFAYFWDGTNWQASKGDTTNGVWVNVKNATQPGSAIPANSSPVVANQILRAGGTSIANALSVASGVSGFVGINCTGIVGGAAGFCIAYDAIATPAAGALTPSLILGNCQFAAGGTNCSFSVGPNSIKTSTIGLQVLLSTAASPLTYTTGTDTGYLAGFYQ